VVAGLPASGLFIPQTGIPSCCAVLLVMALGMFYSGYRHGGAAVTWISPLYAIRSAGTWLRWASSLSKAEDTHQPYRCERNKT